MKYLKLSLIMMIFAVPVSSHIAALTEYITCGNVFCNGGSVQTNDRYQLMGTLGQPVTGITGNSSHINAVGFCYVYKLHSKPILVEDNPLPEKFKLYGNFPNPFNPSTEMRFELPEKCHVRLNIFSLSGQHIITLLDETVDAGLHSITWSPENLSTGIYLYALEAGKKRLMGKALLLK